MSERSLSDLVFRPESSDGAPGRGPAPETLRDELARLQRRPRPGSRVVPAGREAPEDEQQAPDLGASS